MMDNMNMNTGSSGVLFPIDAALNGDTMLPEERGKRMFLVGGPWGPLYPLGVFPPDFPEEEEDPNP